MTRARGKGARRLLRAALFVGWVAVVVIAVLYLFHFRWRRTLVARTVWLPELARDTGLPLPLLNSLGAFRPGPDRRDLRSEPLARPGFVRVGAFGDSFTFGAEVDGGLDFPSLLQAKLRRAGYTNVEVINFGSPWYGFAQTYRLWDQLGEEYGLDFVLLGPSCFQSSRDLTFHHSGAVAPDYLHGRYVLAGEDVAFLDVIGPPDDRVNEYYRFFPHWRYLRYDRNTPAFLAGLVPSGKELANPFYYSRLSPAQESLELYRRLLRKMVAGSEQVILIHRREEIVDVARALGDSLASAPLSLSGVAVSRRQGHYSALGNDAVAEAFFEALTGQREVGYQVLEASGAPGAAVNGARPESLERFDHAEVRLGGRPIAQLLLDTADDAPDVRFDFRAARAQSLLGVGSDKDNPVALKWLPLTEALDATSKIEMEVTHGDVVRRVPIRSAALSPETQVVAAYFDPKDLPDFERGRLLVDGKQVSGLRQRPEVVGGFDLVARTPLRFFPLHDTSVDLASLEEAPLTLALVGEGERTVEIPLGTATKRRRVLEFSAAGLKKWISLDAARHASVITRTASTPPAAGGQR
jgi:hypothetical protein